MNKPEQQKYNAVNYRINCQISSPLRKFLKVYLAWSRGGEIPSNFDPKCGLCFNLLVFSESEPNLIIQEVRRELEQLFALGGLDIQFPFGHEDYITDADNKEHHRNWRRITWIEDILNEQE